MKYIEPLRVNKESKLRLFCFPYGGGGASAYHSWVKSISEKVELYAIQLPGHETRFNESLRTDMNVVVGELLEEFKFSLNKPFILFGHSLGALICFELTRRLQKHSLRLPEHLIVSGCRAPHLPLSHKPIRDLADPEFIVELIKFNGTPQEILNDPDLLEVFLPIIKADFTIYETYQSFGKHLFPFDITALGGANDATVSKKEIQAWNQYTCFNFNYISLSGDHFFIISAREKVLSIIENLYSRNSHMLSIHVNK